MYLKPIVDLLALLAKQKYQTPEPKKIKNISKKNKKYFKKN
jgi:hypothetical protein